MEKDKQGQLQVALVFEDNSGTYGRFVGAWTTAALAREYLKRNIELRIKTDETCVSTEAIKYHIRLTRVSEKASLL